MANNTREIAIIGAGPAGLTLALTLKARGVPCSIYEKHEKILPTGYSMSLMSNAARQLDKLGAWNRLIPKGCLMEFGRRRNVKNEIVDVMPMGSKKRHGYPSLRIDRSDLNATLLEMAVEQEIPIHYNKSFSGIVSEAGPKGGVEFKFNDGSVYEAALLVGADGVWSKVRNYLAPGVEPEYSGTLAIAAKIPREKINFPKEPADGSDYYLPSMISGDRPAFVMIPEKSDGSSVLMFTQAFNYPDLGKTGFDNLGKDEEKVKEHLRLHQDKWDEPVKSALKALDDNRGYFVWAFVMLPDLPSWVSEGGKVVVIGDAAHAIIPSSGQGVNQAIEDATGLGVMLEYAFDNNKRDDALSEALQFWYTTRRTRVKMIQALAINENNKRLPEEQRNQIAGIAEFEGTEEDRRDWLLLTDVSKDMEQWVAGKV